MKLTRNRNRKGIPVFKRITLAIMMMYVFHYNTSAQLTVSANTVFSVSGNTPLVNTGDLSNSGQMINNGILYVQGNWNNTGIYEEMQGRVIFNGTVPQSISHNNQAFFHLVINGGEISAEDNITIHGSLSLLSGIVTPSERSQIVLTHQSDILSSSELSYINGPLYHSGTGNKFFPVGKNGHYCPVSLYRIEGFEPVTGMELFEPNENPFPGAGLSRVSTDRYWQKTQLSGTFEGALAGIRSSHDNPLQNIADVVIAQAPATGGVFESIGRSADSGPDEVISSLSFNENIIALAESFGIAIINVITPNNDGINDFLTVTHIELVPENEIMVLDRLGNTLYKERNYTNLWNGNELPQGNYYCIFKDLIHDRVFKQTISIVK
ncbi:MAG: gliding motility-associated C-terminal domain-containing protein [Bacteroidales bacterium]|nr:gliding motility-associated C-terminal domain-containing protein [Bacteroidales bacterium]